ncbi:SDR family oxidoreductase [Aldersonia kunmingensis]|uniref:SDR family oxidoreductase n=1 Tax=Aldersonia kunmingensis TaxID=408066 RepID=UPI0008314CF7|nr:NAD(P)H-binding protein [Aldersonia kunmingensis]
MTQRILVTGGTGTLGRDLVERLVATDAVVRVLSRRGEPAAGADAPTWAGSVEWARGDLSTGEGIAGAVGGDVDVVVHCATTQGKKDVDATRTLIEALSTWPDTHLIYISIVGVDRVPFFYYNAKLEAERLIETSGLPFTILRATQFHALLHTLFSAQRWSPVVCVPSRTEFQPIDTSDVAARLVELTAAPAAGRVADIGGPEVRSVSDLARSYLAATGRRRAVLPVRIPGGTGAGYRSGGHNTPENTYGTVTFEDFLAAHTP